MRRSAGWAPPSAPTAAPPLRRTTVAALVAVALGAMASRARASGFASARFGGEHGNVITTNPTALYYNPAGIAFSPGSDVYIDGVLALRQGSWEHTLAPTDVANPPEAATGNAGRAAYFNVFGAPMAGGVLRLGKLALGAALYVPFGGRISYQRNEQHAGDPNFGQAVDGVQRWTITEGSLTFIYGTVGVGYRLGPLGLGLTANLVHSSVQNTQAENPTGNGDPDSLHEGRNVLDVSGTHGSFGVGAMLEAVPNRLWLGVSYQSRPGFGSMTLNGTLVLTYQGAPLTTRVSFTNALPDIVRLGVRFRPSEQLELRFFGDLTRWSALQTHCISLEGQPCAVFPNGQDATPNHTTVLNLRRFWNDTYGVRAGASYWLGSRWELFAGLGFETAAVPDSTLDPALPDAPSVLAALGMIHEVAPGLFIGGSYTDNRYFNRDNTGQSDLARAELPTRRADGGGNYKGWLGVFNLNVEKQFQ